MKTYLSLLLLVAIPMGAQQTTGHLDIDQPKVVSPSAFHNCSEDNPKDFHSAFCNSHEPHEECHYTPHHEPTGEAGFECDAIVEYSLHSDGSKVVKLSDEEYSHLQALRQAVVDEEKNLAVKYGADVPPLCSSLFSAQAAHVCEMSPLGPHYEFHQQFLLIDKSQWTSGISDVQVKDLPRNCDGCNPMILNRWSDGSVLRGAAK